MQDDGTDPVFRALADRHRRLLLDRLQARDGQTLSELHAYLPSMTRFGCMKHLRILEGAGLVTSRKAGRERLHYLNPIPIQQVYDRWVSKYARPWAATLTGLKRRWRRDPCPRSTRTSSRSSSRPRRSGSGRR